MKGLCDFVNQEAGVQKWTKKKKVDVFADGHAAFTARVLMVPEQLWVCRWMQIITMIKSDAHIIPLQRERGDQLNQEELRPIEWKLPWPQIFIFLLKCFFEGEVLKHQLF